MNAQPQTTEQPPLTLELLAMRPQADGLYRAPSGALCVLERKCMHETQPGADVSMAYVVPQAGRLIRQGGGFYLSARAWPLLKVARYV
jgi:hypothetical protein